MRIQSYELQMETKNTEYRSMIESQMSFETYFTKLPNGIELNEKEDAFVEDKNIKSEKSCMCNYLENQEKTLNGIISNLIKMLQERVGEEEVNEDNINGYFKMSKSEKYEEFESIDFSTTGKIQTDKGSLDINLNFAMSRSFVVENRIDIYSPFDPLVINLSGDIPTLSTDTFSFDLDNDGVKDQISKLGSGSGFLALDKNKDGKINQGSELFGTRSGDGFGELSAYDEDFNSWIDEGDSIFDSLQIWLKNEDTNENELVGLGEAGIGAIYLNSASSEFTYKTSLNQTLGEMRSSGIFLYEDGAVGNVSQIDFAMREVKNTVEVAEVDTSKTQPLATLLQA
ncbi:hypothetical protein JHD48_00725 [Sulfurimonas sp. SAG-AH-194-I05]|nr:hypothetical protein [Sulfurimonas sp. SAG-AH-194-I05]MDF1874251.1 hypothetical protein [Sulfurimonas sp. SAG-AH-194-I05]